MRSPIGTATCGNLFVNSSPALYLTSPLALAFPLNCRRYVPFQSQRPAELRRFRPSTTQRTRGKCGAAVGRKCIAWLRDHRVTASAQSVHTVTKTLRRRLHEERSGPLHSLEFTTPMAWSSGYAVTLSCQPAHTLSAYQHATLHDVEHRQVETFSLRIAPHLCQKRLLAGPLPGEDPEACVMNASSRGAVSCVRHRLRQPPWRTETSPNRAPRGARPRPRHGYGQ